VTAALGLALQRQGFCIGVMKPIETGVQSNDAYHVSDGQYLQQLLAPNEELSLIAPYQFPQPVAPIEAARLANCTINFEDIQQALFSLAERHTFMLVEGIGGVMVPISEKQDVRDLIQHLQLPCLVVSRTALGAINHTRLTLEALQNAGLKILAVVLNHLTQQSDSQEKLLQTDTTIRLIRQWSPVPVIGPLRFQEHLTNEWKNGVTQLVDDPVMTQLVKIVMGSVS